MDQDIIKILKYDSESSVLDFKKENYHLGNHPKRNDILKDISSFANHPADTPKYIFLGISELCGGGGEIIGIQETLDEANFQQFLNENIEPKINFEFKYVKYQDHTIGYFKIHENNDRPYLFKKDVKNLKTDKVEYKKGDGYIRIGTGTKKIDRSDFDEIYHSKLKNPDRKSDLIIKPYFASPKGKEFFFYDVQYIDIEIINTSNKSIDFDVEMKVYRGNDFILMSEPQLKKALKIHKTESIMGHNIGMIQPPNFHVSITEDEEYILVHRNKLTRKTAISLPQHSNERDVFCEYLFVVQNEKHEIRAEVIIRSDAFTEGPLKKELIFKDLDVDEK